ncbi:uncharacterized protein LOC132003128 isoform X4 [Mustela nigripes]|uniref:uncharacterized protein LOC132003128 isoform X4 n=1 Tax=Mustela nigripes TaxID=77151 RepID=UPI00281679DB|nr:uncharacterized protein LOC132003128 isoform X4 [Mustela nigripes]
MTPKSAFLSLVLGPVSDANPSFEEAGSFLLPTTVEQQSVSLEPTARGRPAWPRARTHTPSDTAQVWNLCLMEASVLQAGQSQELANGSWVKEAKDGPNPLVWAGGRIRMPSSRWQAANRVPAPRHRACLSLLSGPGPRDSQAASLRTAARPATLPSSCPEMGTVNGAHRIHHPCVGTVGPLRTRCLSRSVSCREHGGAQQAGRHTASCTTILFQSLCNKEHC